MVRLVASAAFITGLFVVAHEVTAAAPRPYLLAVGLAVMLVGFRYAFPALLAAYVRWWMR